MVAPKLRVANESDFVDLFDRIVLYKTKHAPLRGDVEFQRWYSLSMNFCGELPRLLAIANRDNNVNPGETQHLLAGTDVNEIHQAMIELGRKIEEIDSPSKYAVFALLQIKHVIYFRDQQLGRRFSNYYDYQPGDAFDELKFAVLTGWDEKVDGVELFHSQMSLLGDLGRLAVGGLSSRKLRKILEHTRAYRASELMQANHDRFGRPADLPRDIPDLPHLARVLRYHPSLKTRLGRPRAASDPDPVEFTDRHPVSLSLRKRSIYRM
ncbi:hypothetical protein JCM11491_005056 [Sporobolomyces phaffii]